MRQSSAALWRLAPAKVNLYLHVLGRRADGYHDLDSLVVGLDIGDQLTIAPAADLRLQVSGPFAANLGPAHDNLVMAAARGLRAVCDTTLGAAIHLEKRLPVAAGLGGGSADAAAALSGLMALWDRQPEPAALDRLARSLGADVPVCLFGAPAVVGGIGERITPTPSLPNLHVVLAWPAPALATADVFAAHRATGEADPILSRAYADVAGFVGELRYRRNDLEPTARALCPAIGDALALLAAAEGCVLARMSGSGACCFGLFASTETAAAAALRIGALRSAWWVVAARFLGGS